MRNWSMVIGGVVMGAALIAGCGGGAAPAAGGRAAGGGGAVTATLGDLTLKLDTNTGKAGAITFKADNKGALPHELVVIKTDLAADKLPQKDGLADETANKVIGKIQNVAPGKADSKAITLDAGKYVILCNVAGHYAGGMTAAFTVQ